MSQNFGILDGRSLMGGGRTREVRLYDRFCFREYNMYIVPKFMLTVSCDGNPIIY